MRKEKERNIFKRIPKYGYICGVLYFILQYSLYLLGRLLSVALGTDAYAFCPKIPIIDDNIPLVPFFATIYVLSYIFWIIGPMAVSLTKKENFINYIIGLTAAYIIGFLFFVFLPSYMDRAAEGLLFFQDNGDPFNFFLNLIYSNDGSEYAYNLFPSYHCLISMYCYLGIRKQPGIPRWYKIFSLVCVLLICASTVFTKQHYFIDIIAGIAISIICYLIVNKINPGKALANKKLTAK